MRLCCPGCGLVASTEAWGNDAAARDALAAVAGLPAPLPGVLPSYLSLFRPEKSALGWAKALRLTRDLAALVGRGHVQIGAKVARPCPPAIWAAAIDDMLGRRERLERPMKNHKYLCLVAYGLAVAADAQAEQKQHEQQRQHPTRPEGPTEEVDYTKLTALERSFLPQRLREKHNI